MEVIIISIPNIVAFYFFLECKTLVCKQQHKRKQGNNIYKISRILDTVDDIRKYNENENNYNRKLTETRAQFPAKMYEQVSSNHQR